MSQPSTAITERVGVQEVGLIFTKRLGWFFREQSVSDFGVDAEVEVADAEGRPSGQLMKLQIKSGTSFFKTESQSDFTFYARESHVQYWLQHAIPVFLILHNPETGITLWQRIERHLFSKTRTGWSIKIPKANVLDARAKNALSSGIGTDRESIKRYRFASDRDDMKRYRGRKVFFRFDFWVNKTLSLRKVDIYFDTYDKPAPDERRRIWSTNCDVHGVMSHFFPWLAYKYTEIIWEEEQLGEIASEILRVKLTKEARRFLALETFFEDPNDPEPPEKPERDDEDDKYGFDEWAFRRALERDQ